MDYEAFISENIQEATKELNSVIQYFKTKRLKISFDFIDSLSKKIDLLENTNQKQFFIFSFVFENIVTDLDKINELILTEDKKDISNDYLIRDCFDSSILEGVLNDKYKKSESHKKYLDFIEVNTEYLDNQVKTITNTLIKDKKLIDRKYLNNLKNWCFEVFNTPKFYTRKYIYLYFYKNKTTVNLMIDSGYVPKTILEELQESFEEG